MSRFAITVLFVVALLGVRAEAAVVWPDDDEWVDVLSPSGGVYDDTTSESVNPRSGNLVGGTDSNGESYALARWYAYGKLFFSLRVDGLQGQLGGIWQVLFDLDVDGDLDYVLELDANGGKGSVQLLDVITDGPTIEDVELDEDNPLWEDTTGDYFRVQDPTGDDSAFEGDSDVFVEFAIGLGTFRTETGIGRDDEFAIGFTTSTTEQLINKDIALGLSGTDDVADLFSGSLVASPEPGTLLLTGLGLLALLAWARARRRRAGRSPRSLS